MITGNKIALTILILVYLTLTVQCVNHVYFWDNIQQVSKEAHWFYQNGFSSLIIQPSHEPDGIVATGYHPPLMGIMTALLWKMFGYSLWVSHVFIFLWAVILMFHLSKLINLLFPKDLTGWIMLIVLFEPTVLSQFAIASPDFILFTAFILAVRGILEKKQLLGAVGVFFLCCINMRGVFAGAILFVVQAVFSMQEAASQQKMKNLLTVFYTFLPTFVLLAVYYTYYFMTNGWFFAHASASTEHYSMPHGLTRIIRHLAEFVLRTIENGRLVIWIAGVYGAFLVFKHKTKIPKSVQFLFVLFLLINALYLLFVGITQMPFSARYFMPQFFALTVVGLWVLTQNATVKKLKLIFLIILVSELTGNLWVYPDSVAKSWDCTLAHLPYYQLRNECFDFIKKEKIDYKDVSAGFCLYGNRKFVELKNDGEIVGTNTDRKYFIYSNISNVDDSLYNDLKNRVHWKPVKLFEEGFVQIVIFEKSNLMP